MKQIVLATDFQNGPTGRCDARSSSPARMVPVWTWCVWLMTINHTGSSITTRKMPDRCLQTAPAR